MSLQMDHAMMRSAIADFTPCKFIVNPATGRCNQKVLFYLKSNFYIAPPLSQYARPSQHPPLLPCPGLVCVAIVSAAS